MPEAPRVKICGLTNPEDMEHAAATGADYLGVILAPSRRRVSADALDEWVHDARGLAEVVGVFVDASFSEVVEAVDRFDLDFVQLHGQEDGEAWGRLPVRLIETRIAGPDGFGPRRFPGAAWADLFDAGSGEGRTFDWSLVGETTREQRVFLAGGLTPQNVREAVRAVRPFAVDVASGVEREPGRKDPAAVEAFVRNAKEAWT